MVYRIQREPMIIKKVGGMPVSTNAIDLTDLNLKQEKEFNKLVRAHYAEKGKIGPIKNIQNLIKGLSKKEQLAYCSLLSRGGLPGNCAAAIDANPVKTAEIFSKAEATTNAMSKS